MTTTNVRIQLTENGQITESAVFDVSTEIGQMYDWIDYLYSVSSVWIKPNLALQAVKVATSADPNLTHELAVPVDGQEICDMFKVTKSQI